MDDGSKDKLYAERYLGNICNDVNYSCGGGGFLIYCCQ